MNGNDPMMDNYCALAYAIAMETGAQQALMKFDLLAARVVRWGQDKAVRDAEIVRRYTSGQDVPAISLEMDVHRQTVYNALAAAKVSLRKREGK